LVGSGITSYLHICLDGLHTPKKDLIHYIACVQPKILIQVRNVNTYAKVPTFLVDFKCYQKKRTWYDIRFTAKSVTNKHLEFG
jgi:hypothetical protein